jgi:hypothetical protein
VAHLRLRIQGRRREVMGGRSWTELFFLDEATALAAGIALLLLPPRRRQPVSRRVGAGQWRLPLSRATSTRAAP